MTVSTDELYRKVELETVATAEARLRARYVEVYGQEEGSRRLEDFFSEMASNIESDSRPLSEVEAAG